MSTSPNAHLLSDLDDTYRGETALHIAIVKDSHDVVEALVAAGADVFAWPRADGRFFSPPSKTEPGVLYYGETAFAFAVATGHFRDHTDFWLGLDLAAEIGRMETRAAAFDAEADTFERLAKASSRSELKEVTGSVNTYILLHGGDAASVASLYRRQAARARRYAAAATAAAGAPGVSMTKRFLLDMRDSHGYAPLHIATMLADEAAYVGLLDAGAEAHPVNELGLTPVTLAVALGDQRFFDFIIGTSAFRQVHWRYGSILCVSYPLTCIVPMPTSVKAEALDYAPLPASAADARVDDVSHWVTWDTTWREPTSASPWPPTKYRSRLPTAVELMIEHRRIAFSTHPLLLHVMKPKWQAYGCFRMSLWFVQVALALAALSLLLYVKPSSTVAARLLSEEAADVLALGIGVYAVYEVLQSIVNALRVGMFYFLLDESVLLQHCPSLRHQSIAHHFLFY